MNIALLTSANSISTKMFSLLVSTFLRQSDSWNIYVYVVRHAKKKNLFKRIKRKIELRGFLSTVILVLTKVLRKSIDERDSVNFDRYCDSLIDLNYNCLERIKFIDLSELNSEESASIVSICNPDVLVQFGAGIIGNALLNRFPDRILNMHHGIAPNIRGVDSILWALYYGKFNLVGGTLHIIDSGIDTGRVISHVFEKDAKYLSFSQIYFNVTQMLFDSLMSNLSHFSIYGEFSQTSKLVDDKVNIYRSSMNGLQRLLLRLRGW